MAQAQAAVAQAEAQAPAAARGRPAGRASRASRRREANLRPRAPAIRTQRRTSRRRASSASRRSTTRSATSTSRESQLDAARLQVADQRPDRQRLPDGADRARSRRARALGAAQARLDQTVIRAPVDGIADRPQRRAGRRRAAGQGTDGAGAGRRDADRRRRSTRRTSSQLKLGQKALASADAYPRERFAAELFYINPGHRRAARLGRSQAARARPAGLPAAGHDGVGRHRGRAARRTLVASRPTPCSTPPARSRGCSPSTVTAPRSKPVTLGLQGRRPRRDPRRRRAGRPADRRRQRGVAPGQRVRVGAVAADGGRDEPVRAASSRSSRSASCARA